MFIKQFITAYIIVKNPQAIKKVKMLDWSKVSCINEHVKSSGWMRVSIFKLISVDVTTIQHNSKLQETEDENAIKYMLNINGRRSLACRCLWRN